MTYYQLSEELCRMHFEYAGLLHRVDISKLSEGRGGILLWLYLEEESRYATDIIEKFHLTPGRVANVIKRFVDDGLVVKENDDEDARRYLITLTDKGKEKAFQQYTDMLHDHMRVLQYLSEEDARTYISLLSKLLKNMSKEDNL